MSKVDARIKHLSEKEIIEMITKYYKGTSVSQLKQEYLVNATASQFVNTFPKKLTDENCQYCDVNMVEDWKAKNSYSFNNKVPYCPNCKHENHEKCKCKTCEENRKKLLIQEENRKRDLISSVYKESNYNKIPEHELSVMV